MTTTISCMPLSLAQQMMIRCIYCRAAIRTAHIRFTAHIFNCVYVYTLLTYGVCSPHQGSCLGVFVCVCVYAHMSGTAAWSGVGTSDEDDVWEPFTDLRVVEKRTLVSRACPLLWCVVCAMRRTYTQKTDKTRENNSGCFFVGFWCSHTSNGRIYIYIYKYMWNVYSQCNSRWGRSCSQRTI